MDRDKIADGPQTERLAKRLSIVSSLMTFLLVFGIVAAVGTWCFTASGGKSKEKSKPRPTLADRIATQHAAFLEEVQQDIEDQFQENMDDVSAWQEELEEQNEDIAGSYDSDE